MEHLDWLVYCGYHACLPCLARRKAEGFEVLHWQKYPFRAID